MRALTDLQRFVLLAVYDAGGTIGWKDAMHLKSTANRRIQSETWWNLIDRGLVDWHECPTCEYYHAGYTITPKGVEAIHE